MKIKLSGLTKAGIWLFLPLASFVVAAGSLWLNFGNQPDLRDEAVSGVQTAMARPGLELRREPIVPISRQLDLDERKIALGERLFHDTRLSRDGTVACATCHDLAKGGTDRLPRSRGIGGAVGAVNAPTVFNSGFNFVQFWDGRAATLEEQIDGPVQHPSEMGSTWPGIIAKLNQDQDYVAAFAEIYGGGIQSDNVKDAIANYERSLITPNSRFDRFLLGDTDAITEREKAGYELFKSLGCSSCHNGTNVGANMFQGFGIFGSYFRDRGDITEADFGRFNVTGRVEDRFVFRVPSLRNIELTAPYFHDGSAQTLERAVEIMTKYQLGRPLSIEQAKLIVAFLKTLTGEYSGNVP